jgi:large repetitive protein
VQLQASDGSLSGTATCTVYVEDFTVDAGVNQTIAVGATANLTGTCTYSGPGTRAYAWSVISVPTGATVTFGTGTTLATTASGFSVAGDYVLQLDAYDGGAYVRDRVTITAQSNRPPTVDAGADVDPAYETLNTPLHAAANDLDGDPLTYAWVQTAGKAVTYVGGTNAADLTFTVPLVDTVAEAGLTFQVTVNDGKGGVVSDSVNVRARIIGDATLDDACDVLDLLTLVYTFGLSTGDPGFDPAADFNKDGAVDVLDLLYLVDGFGRALT